MTVRSALRAPVRAAARSPIILRKRWTPAALFAQGQQGVWYEPKPEYLYQDAAGTVPVTADGDPVGLMLDRSGGLSEGQPEIVDPQAWDDSQSDWENIDGELICTATEPGQLIVQTGVFPGARYEVSFSVDFFAEEGSAPLLNVAIGNATTVSHRANLSAPRGGGVTQHYTLALVKYTEQITFSPNRYTGTAAPFTGRIYNISVRELPGNHATQSTSAARPIYRTDGALHWLESDGVDDFFETGKAVLSGVDYYLAHAAMATQDNRISLSFTSGGSSGDSHVLYQDARSDPKRIGRVGGNNVNRYLNRTAKLSPGIAEVSSVERYVASGATGYINGVLVDTLPASIMGSPGDVSNLKLFSYFLFYSAMNFYGGVVRNGVISASDRVRVEEHLASLAGVTL